MSDEICVEIEPISAVGQRTVGLICQLRAAAVVAADSPPTRRWWRWTYRGAPGKTQRMSSLQIGATLFVSMLILMSLRVPLSAAMGLDPWELAYSNKAIWFGIPMLMVMQIGLVHPPVGLNINIINSLAKDVPMMETFKGVIPFLMSDFLRVILLFFVPSVSLWLVHVFD